MLNLWKAERIVRDSEKAQHMTGLDPWMGYIRNFRMAFWILATFTTNAMSPKWILILFNKNNGIILQNICHFVLIMSILAKLPIFPQKPTLFCCDTQTVIYHRQIYVAQHTISNISIIFSADIDPMPIYFPFQGSISWVKSWEELHQEEFYSWL